MMINPHRRARFGTLLIETELADGSTVFVSAPVGVTIFSRTDRNQVICEEGHADGFGAYRTMVHPQRLATSLAACRQAIDDALENSEA